MNRSLADTTGVLKPLLGLVGPIMAEQFLHLFMGLSDKFLAGHFLPEKYLSPINLVSYLVWLLESFFLVVSIGATALVARFVGARNFHEARHAAGQALVTGAALALVITVGGFVLGPRVVAILQAKGEFGQLCNQYLDHIYPSLPMAMTLTVGAACLRGAGDTTSGLIVTTLAIIVDAVVSWLLVLGYGPPLWTGWVGLAVGTSAGYTAGAVAVVALLMRRRGAFGVQLRQLWPDAILIRRLLRVGLPGGADLLALVMCQLWFVSLINRVGEAAGAAHGLAIAVEAFAYLPGGAFQQAAATMTGQFLGAGDFARARSSVKQAAAFALVVMTLVGVVFLIWAPQLLGLMVDDDKQHVALAAAPLLRTVALAMPALAILMIVTGSLRGAGDTRWPLGITLSGFLLVRIPLAYVFITYFGWGVEGAWIAMWIDLHIRCALALWRFFHGGWQRVRV